MSDIAVDVHASILKTEEAKMSADAEMALLLATDYAITDDAGYALAAEELRIIMRKSQELETRRTDITGPINKGLRAINALFAGPAAKLEQAAAQLKRAMLAYTNEIERKNKEAQEAAAAKAEQEAQELKRAADAALATGDVDKAQEIASEAAQKVVVAAQAPIAHVPKAAGIVGRKTIVASVTDKAALVRYLAEPGREELMDALIDIKLPKLQSLARTFGGNLNYPGVTIDVASGISVRK